LEQVLILMLRDITWQEYFALFSSRKSMETHLISEMKGYLRERLTQRVCIEDICNHFGYSKTYLSHLFKDQCGVSILTYYTQKKIAYAQKLILEDRYSFAQISNLLAFDSPQYFARVFKRVTGQTPTEYQNAHTLSAPTE
jgi:AraC-like DNA-binding protein